MEENKNTTVENLKKYFAEAPFTIILVLANVIAFIALELLGGSTNSQTMLKYGAMNPYMVVHFGQWYRLFAAMFMHFGIEHLLNNMLLLALLGQIFEKAVGTTRFAAIYLGAGLTGSFLSLMYECLMGQNDLIAGASGAIFGIVGGMLVVIIVHKGRYAGITTRRMILMAVLTLYYGFASAGTDNVGHIGGLLSGIVYTFMIYGIPLILKSKKSILKNNKKSDEEM